VKVDDIGLLFKVRLFFQDKHEGSSWHLAKVLVSFIMILVNLLLSRLLCVI